MYMWIGAHVYMGFSCIIITFTFLFSFYRNKLNNTYLLVISIPSPPICDWQRQVLSLHEESTHTYSKHMHTHTHAHIHACRRTHPPPHTHTHTYAHTHTGHTHMHTLTQDTHIHMHTLTHNTHKYKHTTYKRTHTQSRMHTHTHSQNPNQQVTDQSQVLGLQEELSQRPHHRLLHGAGLIVLGRDLAVQVPQGSQQTEVDGRSRWRAGVQRRRQAERVQGGVRGGCWLAPGQALLLRGDDAQQKLDGLEALGGRLLTRHAGQASPDVTEW